MRFTMTLSIIIFTVIMSGCTTFPEKLEYTDGMKQKIAKVPEGSAILVFTPRGHVILADADGNVAKKCRTPEVKKDSKDKKSRTEGECLGVGTGFNSDTLAPSIVLSKPNPHGCAACYDVPIAPGIWWEVCYPKGCDAPHP